jgi:hypothetical protein
VMCFKELCPSNSTRVTIWKSLNIFFKTWHLKNMPEHVQSFKT